MQPAKRYPDESRRRCGGLGLCLALAGVAAAIFVADTAIAHPKITVDERSYDIEGDSVEALRSQMAERGPFSEKADGHVPARMEATVGFRFTTYWNRGACRIGRIRVTADIAYIYPRWLNFDDASEGLRDKWTNYIKHLRLHEEGHGQMVFDAANEVEAMLSDMGGSKNCKKLRLRARARGEEILRGMAAAQIEYDSETDGGKNQGAVLEEDSEPADEPAIN